MARWGRWAPIALGISLAAIVGILVWFQAKDDIDILADLRGFDRTVLAPALGLHVLMHVLWATRLRVLAGGLDVPLGGPGAWRLATAGQFAGGVTPGRMGAEAMRLSLLMRSGVSGIHASRMVLADRTTDMVFFLGAGTVGAVLLSQVFGPEAAALRGIAWLAVAGLFTVMVLLFGGLYRPRPVAVLCQGVASAAYRIVRKAPPDVASRVEQLFADVRIGVIALLRDRPLRAAVAIGLSFTVWAAEFAVLWLVLIGFGHTLPYAVVFAAGIMLTLLAPVAISPGGAGAVEVAAVVLLGGLAAGLTPVFVLVWRALTYYYDVVVGGLVAAWQWRIRRLT